MGSWAPAATECYQEAIRFPPVRLFRAGVEEADVFAILRNNVRLSALVEMDLRALVAGCHVADALTPLIALVRRGSVSSAKVIWSAAATVRTDVPPMCG